MRPGFGHRHVALLSPVAAGARHANVNTALRWYTTGARAWYRAQYPCARRCSCPKRRLGRAAARAAGFRCSCRHSRPSIPPSCSPSWQTPAPSVVRISSKQALQGCEACVHYSRESRVACSCHRLWSGHGTRAGGAWNSTRERKRQSTMVRGRAVNQPAYNKSSACLISGVPVPAESVPVSAVGVVAAGAGAGAGGGVGGSSESRYSPEASLRSFRAIQGFVRGAFAAACNFACSHMFRGEQRSRTEECCVLTSVCVWGSCTRVSVREHTCVRRGVVRVCVCICVCVSVNVRLRPCRADGRTNSTQPEQAAATPPICHSARLSPS